MKALLALAGALMLIAGGAAPMWWWMNGRLETCRLDTAIQAAAVKQRDGVIETLEAANSDLGKAIEQRNTEVLRMAREGQKQQETAVAALAAARRSNDATNRTIAALSAQIQAGGGDCAKAVAQIRAGL